MSHYMLQHGEKKVELKCVTPTLGNPVIPATTLPEDAYWLDPGYKHTASCESKITYIDGASSTLLYRGYPAQQLAQSGDFMDTCFTLLHGDLPNSQQKQQFEDALKAHADVHEQIKSFFQGFRRDAHPMAIMVGVVGALSAFYHDGLDINNPEDRRLSAYRLIAKMPTIAAMCYKYSIGQPFVYPQTRFSYAENFLNMMFATPYEPSLPNPVYARAIDQLFTLHADHEQNASTTTVRVAGSTGANPFACIASGITALWGPAHGGANEAVLRMLQRIKDPDEIPRLVQRAKDPNDPFRLMGFGHRVYKSYDPRADVMRATCKAVLEETGKANDPIFLLAQELERIALEDEYFIEKKLYPNIDFYSGITMSAIGIPTNLFTVLFAVARTVGWVSHWMEMISDPKRPLARPRQCYMGPKRRDFVPIDQRDPLKDSAS